MPIRILPKVGPLQIVRTRLARYEAGEIAHIENVMRTEKRERDHRRLRQYEEIFTTEEEIEEENTRDLQTTERFELENQIRELQREEERLAGGVSVSGSYGFVSVSAYGEYSRTSTDEIEREQATRYAKDVTERAVSRISERTKTTRTRRTHEEVEEANHHGFENDNDSHVRGIYRWVDKLYRAKRFDYRGRMMYELHVPEPAAYYLHSLATRSAREDILEEPQPPKHPAWGEPLRPDHLDENTYIIVAEQYGADGIAPPPSRTIQVRRGIAKDFDPKKLTSVEIEDGLEVPEGYQVYYAEGLFDCALKTTQTNNIPRTIVFSSSRDIKFFIAGYSGGSSEEEPRLEHHPITWSNWAPLNILGGGRIPISITATNMVSLNVNITLYCLRTDALMQKWQLETYTAIMSAYRKAVADYEERLAEASVREGVSISGNNPARNEQIIRRELRKQFLMALTDSDWSIGSGILHTPGAPPPGDLPELDRGLLPAWNVAVPFFENSFEWDKMSFQFFQSYWKPKERWIDADSVEDPDPLFETFLSAGQARVIVPVKRGAERAVLFYQLTGRIWPEILGEVPALPTSGNPLFDYIGDVLDDLDRLPPAPLDPDTSEVIETDDAETWLLKVPTDTVWLQEDGELPDLEAEST